MKKLTAFIILTFVTVLFAASVSAQTLTVTNSYANCRSKAGASNVYLGKVYKGQSYDILGSAKAPNGKLWYKVHANGKDCYICSAFVRVNPAKATTKQSSTKKRYIGRMKITGYDGCKKCGTGNGITASGRRATVGRTVAMKGYPFGTRVYIVGLGTYTVEDRGVGRGIVDVFCRSHKECYAITGYRDVYILE